MSAAGKVRYALSLTLGVAVWVFLWARFQAGGPLPKPHGLRLVHDTALRHEREVSA